MPIIKSRKYQNCMNADLVVMSDIVRHSDKVLIEDFEKSFYTAYSPVKQQKLIRQIWIWDDEKQRISLRCPISSAIIFVWFENGRPGFYVAGSFDRTTFSQLDYYGFQKPNDVGIYGEVLTLHPTPWLTTSILKLDAVFLKPFCYAYAKSHGATHLLATCSKAMLTLYKRWGWLVLESKTIKGEERFFIQYCL